MRHWFLIPISGLFLQAATPVRPVVFEPGVRPHEFVSVGPGGAVHLTSAGIEFAAPGHPYARLSLTGARLVQPQAGDPLPSISNYYSGSDPNRWRLQVPNYGSVRYQGVYPGVDLAVHTSGRDFEYDFILAPYADPSKIGLRFAGAPKLSISEAGDLVIGDGWLTQRRLRAYQDGAAGRSEVAVHFAVRGGKVRFVLGQYDRSRVLVIDPLTTYESYLGGTGYDAGSAVAVDPSGNIFVGGETVAYDFPGPDTYGAKPTAQSPYEIGFISKFAPLSGGQTKFLANYFLDGGTQSEFNAVFALAIDSAGNLVAAGTTTSEAFPLLNAVQQHMLGNNTCISPAGPTTCPNGFVTKFSSSGSLVFSTYYGGSSSLFFNALAIDSAGDIYAAGNAQQGTSLQGTANSYEPVGPPSNTTQNAVLAKFGPSGSLLYATFLGGYGVDTATTIAVAKPGVVWVGGGTSSTGFPTTTNAFQPSFTGLTLSAYVAQIDTTQSGKAALTYSTLFDGQGNSTAAHLFLDSTGQVVFCGSVWSDLPLTATAAMGYQGVPNSEVTSPAFVNGDGFIARLNPTLSGASQLTYSSYVGGSDSDGVSGCALDPQGNFLVVGNTLSGAPFLQPGSPIPLKLIGSGYNLFAARINPYQAGGLLEAMLWGGENNDQVNAMTTDANGFAYLTGGTYSSYFPTSANALQFQPGGTTTVTGINPSFAFGDAFLTQLNLNAYQTAVAQLIPYQGNYQFGAPDSILPQALSVQLADAKGNPLPLAGYAVVYTGNNGVVLQAEGAYTNGSGITGLQAKLGASSGTVTATIDGTSISTTFQLTAISGALPQTVAIVAGNNQTGNASTPLAKALQVQLADGNGNPLQIAGITVQFQGTNATVSSPTAVTNASGSASVNVTLGSQAGAASVIVTAGSLPPVTANFTVNAVKPSGPAITPGGVVNAASAQAGTVSPGMIVVIYGQDIGPSQIAVNALGSNGVMSSQVGQTQVFFDGVAAPILYASSGQTSAIVPYEVAGKTSTVVTVQYQGTQSAGVTLAVTSSELGLFTANTSGSGQGAILNQDLSVNSASNPAAAGSIIVLYGTGEGQTSPAGVDGQAAINTFPKPLQPITATVGGMAATVLYYGAAPTLVAGALQVNVQLPAGLPAGNAVVQIAEGSVQSPSTVTVAVKGQ